MDYTPPILLLCNQQINFIMKKIIIIAFVMLSMTARAQENNFILSGGWASASPEYYSGSATGYRINALFERSDNGKIFHGINVGYVHTTGSETSTGVGNNPVTASATIGSWPLYYAPKIMIGNGEKIKFFLKGALGWQFSSYKAESPALSVETHDSGFYGGLGAGARLNLGEKLFLNFEYEWAYAANIYYGNGFLNTAQAGLGFKLQ